MPQSEYHPRRGRRSAVPGREAATERAGGRHLVARSYRMQTSTVRADDRSVEAVLATEGAVWVWDYAEWRPIREILAMAGLEAVPERLPLLDSHNRNRVGDQLGSTREIRVEADRVIGRRYLGRQQAALDAFHLIADGHLTDGSIGYEILEFRTLRDGESVELGGRTYANAGGGDLRLVTRWRLFEDSLTPIGADPDAKMRDATPTAPRNAHQGRKPASHRSTDMGFHAWLRARGLDHDTLDDAERQRLRAEFDAEQAAGASGTSDGDGARGATQQHGQRHTAPAAPVAVSADAIELHARRQAATAGVDLPSDFDFTQFRSLDAVNGYILGARAQAQRSEPNAPVGGARVTADGVDKRRAAAIDALASMGGAREGDDLGMRRRRPTEILRELVACADPMAAARMGHEDLCLMASGRDLHHVAAQVGLRDANQIASTFAVVLKDASNRVAMLGFRSARVTNRRWTRERLVNDFRTQEGAGVLAGLLAEQDAAGAPFNEAVLIEKSYSAKLGLFGRSFKFTYQDWRNDDLGELLATIRNYGQLAGLTEDYLAYKAVLGIDFAGLSQVQTTAAFWDDSNDRVKLQGLAKVTGALEGRTITVGSDKIPVNPVVGFLLVPPLRRHGALAATGTAQGQAFVNAAADEGIDVISSPWMANTGISGHADDYIAGASNLDGVVMLRDRVYPEPVLWQVSAGTSPDVAFVIMHACKAAVAYAGAFEKGDWS